MVSTCARNSFWILQKLQIKKLTHFTMHILHIYIYIYSIYIYLYMYTRRHSPSLIHINPTNVHQDIESSDRPPHLFPQLGPSPLLAHPHHRQAASGELLPRTAIGWAGNSVVTMGKSPSKIWMKTSTTWDWMGFHQQKLWCFPTKRGPGKSKSLKPKTCHVAEEKRTSRERF